MAKSDRIYFENLIAAADCACNAANYLVSCMENYQPDQVKDMLATMHGFEHAGDVKKHEMSSALAKAFVTPVDREDLAMVSGNIDDVTDTIEEVLQLFYMYRIQSVFPQALAFAKNLSSICQLMKQMLGAFANFKRPEALLDMVVEINRLEEECDVLFIESIMALESQTDNVLEIISWREIYNRLEQCADGCEHVGDSVELVLMKNS